MAKRKLGPKSAAAREKVAAREKTVAREDGKAEAAQTAVSKALPLASEDLGDLAVGHSPARTLSPEDAQLFRAFQANLLSLISHELRTPLMGVMNALSALDAEGMGSEWLTMARRNAERLQGALSVLLDLAAIESGGLRLSLRELDLARVLDFKLKGREGVKFSTAGAAAADDVAVVLGDPKATGRAVELCLQGVKPFADPAVPIVVRLVEAEQGVVILQFALGAGRQAAWAEAWSHGLAGFEGGVLSPGSAFAGLLQTEGDFLSRGEEGLGSELVLVHELMKRQLGRFSASGAQVVELRLRWGRIEGSRALSAVLESRTERFDHESGSMALAWIARPKGGTEKLETFQKRVKSALFRSTDSAYAVPEHDGVAVVMDDCRAEDVSKIVSRLQSALGDLKLAVRAASCPTDVATPLELLDIIKR